MVIILAEDEMESREQPHLSGIHSIGHKDERRRGAVGHRCGDFGRRRRCEAGNACSFDGFKTKKIGARDLTD